MKDLLKNIDALPPYLAAAVRLAYIDDRSFPQTAKALGCSIHIAHKRTLLGVQRLRRRKAA